MDTEFLFKFGICWNYTCKSVNETDEMAQDGQFNVGFLTITKFMTAFLIIALQGFLGCFCRKCCFVSSSSISWFCFTVTGNTLRAFKTFSIFLNFIHVQIITNEYAILYPISPGWLGIVDDFRTLEWIDNIKFPEKVYQESGVLLSA